MAGEQPAEIPVAGGGSPASATEPAAPASSPAAAAPEAAPAAVEPAQPDAGAAPAAAAPEPAAPAAPEVEPTLLQKFDAEQKAKDAPKPAEPVKPAEPAAAKPAEPAKPVDPAAPAEPAAAAPAEPAAAPVLEPVEYAYELPETIQMDEATKTGFHTALDAFRLDPTKGAQGLIDLHNQTMSQYAEHVASEQQRVWNDTRKGWQTEVMGDEQLGGSGYQTSMAAVARMRDLFVAEKDMAEFDNFLKITGAGDHPAFLRMLHNAARVYDEAPMPPSDPRPTPNNGQPPARGLRSLYKSNQRG